MAAGSGSYPFCPNLDRLNKLAFGNMMDTIEPSPESDQLRDRLAFFSRVVRDSELRYMSDEEKKSFYRDQGAVDAAVDTVLRWGDLHPKVHYAAIFNLEHFITLLDPKYVASVAVRAMALRVLYQWNTKAKLKLVRPDVFKYAAESVFGSLMLDDPSRTTSDHLAWPDAVELLKFCLGNGCDRRELPGLFAVDVDSLRAEIVALSKEDRFDLSTDDGIFTDCFSALSGLMQCGAPEVEEYAIFLASQLADISCGVAGAAGAADDAELMVCRHGVARHMLKPLVEALQRGSKVAGHAAATLKSLLAPVPSGAAEVSYVSRYLPGVGDEPFYYVDGHPADMCRELHALGVTAHLVALGGYVGDDPDLAAARLDAQSIISELGRVPELRQPLVDDGILPVLREPLCIIENYCEIKEKEKRKKEEADSVPSEMAALLGLGLKSDSHAVSIEMVAFSAGVPVPDAEADISTATLAQPQQQDRGSVPSEVAAPSGRDPESGDHSVSIERRTFPAAAVPAEIAAAFLHTSAVGGIAQTSEADAAFGGIN